MTPPSFPIFLSEKLSSCVWVFPHLPSNSIDHKAFSFYLQDVIISSSVHFLSHCLDSNLIYHHLCLHRCSSLLIGLLASSFAPLQSVLLSEVKWLKKTCKLDLVIPLLRIFLNGFLLCLGGKFQFLNMVYKALHDSVLAPFTTFISCHSSVQPHLPSSSSLNIWSYFLTQGLLYSSFLELSSNHSLPCQLLHILQVLTYFFL